MSNKQIKAYATKTRPNSREYVILYSGIGNDCWIPVFESVQGERKLKDDYRAFSEALESGLQFIVVDINPLVSARLIDKKKLHNFH